MEKYHDGYLTIFNNPNNFSLYDLIPVEKVSNFLYSYGNVEEHRLIEQDNSMYLAEGFIFLGFVNAMLAPTEVIDKYFDMFNNHIKDEKVTQAVTSSMDQWSTGFIGVWDYSIYEPNTKLLIYSFDIEEAETNHLVSEEDKKNYLYTNMKTLPREWVHVNLKDIINQRTKENIYKNGDGAFLIHTLHQLDKTQYAIKQERDALDNNVTQVSKPDSKLKL